VHIVVEALRLARLPEAEYTLFGAPTEPYLGHLRLAAERVPGLTFRAFGGFGQAELPMLLADIDAVVIPSNVWESYSIVAREALACRVPVLASRLAALPEAMRESETG